jgi:hypothetical protein
MNKQIEEKSPKKVKMESENESTMIGVKEECVMLENSVITAIIKKNIILKGINFFDNIPND